MPARPAILLCLAGFSCVVVLAGAPAARASDAAAGDPTTRERATIPERATPPELAWHACLREAYARQPGGQSRAAAQRGALDACREHEDRTVAAALAARTSEDRPTGARAWAAGVAASLVDPVAAWIGSLRR